MTQEQRRDATRSKLLDATAASLLAVGYAATTTRRVSDLAGVSLGAQTHHFPHRTDLLAAAAEHLAGQRIERLHSLAAELPPPSTERLPALLDLLWTDFSSPVFTVFVKLWVAADDDAQLYERMIELERRLARTIASAAPELLGLGRDDGNGGRRLLLALSAIRGLALSERFEPRVGPWRDPWPDLRSALIGALQRPAPHPG